MENIDPRSRAILLAAASVALISGCAFQAPEVVEIREPGKYAYSSPAQPVRPEASRLWEFAALSANAYDSEWTPSGIGPRKRVRGVASAGAQAVRECETGEGPIPMPDWVRWSGFPTPDAIKEAEGVGLFFEVWEKNTVAPPIIAVVFRGTDGKSWLDWMSNLRWMVKWITGKEDQYDIVRKTIRREIVAELEKRLPEWTATGKVAMIVATGHSLGGGLAQHLAYSLTDDHTPTGIPPISAAYAFDPSPVTGWYSVPNAQRLRNAKDLKTSRAFEHGEFLAYVRLLFSYVYPPSAAAPEVTEIRFNFNPSWNPLSEHGMRPLACHLRYEASKPGA